MKHEISLDGLKGIAAFIIAFVWHYQHFGVAGNVSPFYKFLCFSYTWGGYMVEVFFMLSGFGMMMGYKEQIKQGQILFKNFLLKRLQKLYPLHFFTLILVSVLEFIILKKIGTTFVYPNYDLYHFFLNLLCLQNGFLGIEWSFNSPSWCISILFIMYCLFYFLIKRATCETEIVVNFTIGAVLGLILLLTGFNYPFFNSLIARGLSCFSIGVLLHYLWNNTIVRNHRAIIGNIAFITCLFIYLVFRLRPHYLGNLQMLMVIGISPLLILSVLTFKPLNFITSLKPITKLGELSMHIYLIHFPVQCCIKVADLYLGLGINYTSKKTWFFYIFSVIVAAVFCKLFLQWAKKKCEILESNNAIAQ